MDRHDAHSLRSRPNHGVYLTHEHPTVVFVTVCTKDRQPWLIEPGVHDRLRTVWAEADAWLLDRYVLMPNHVHIFAAFSGSDIPLDNWIRYWKSRFRMADLNPEHTWQANHWDTRLRTRESYEEKWMYVRDNPVRHGLVGQADDWSLQGEIHCLPW